MAKTHKIGQFQISVYQNHIDLEHNGSVFRFRPAEAEQVKSILSMAGGMEHFDALPPKIAYSPFMVRFFEDNHLELVRKGDEEGLSFDWGQIDAIITTITEAVKVSVDDKKGKPRQVVHRRMSDEAAVYEE